MGKKLLREFYSRNTLTVARELLGKHIVRKTAKGIMRGVIVETEAYAGIFDPASHTFKNKQTERTKIWYEEGGYAYVYQIHGIYFCLGITAEKESVPGAVLIRAVKPIDGIELMKEYRAETGRGKSTKYSLENLTSGPSKFCMAFDINKECDNTDLCISDEFYLDDVDTLIPISDIVFAPRINVDYAGRGAIYHWRYYLRNDDKFVSIQNNHRPLSMWMRDGYPEIKPLPNRNLFEITSPKLESGDMDILMNKLSEIPKVELHIHLEGCITVNTLLQLAIKNNVKIPKHIYDTKSLRFSNFDEFVHTYYSICGAITSEDDFRLVINDVIEYVKRNKLIYCEVSWTPFLYLNRGFDFFKVMAVMNDELAKSGFSDVIKFIIDVQRDHGIEAGESVFTKVFMAKDFNIVGIGLTGQEEGFDPASFDNLFAQAKGHSLGCTAHAGEFGTAFDIWQCIKHLGVTRIGHGIRAVNDPNLLDYLYNEKIHLEICPTSNLKLERVLGVIDHPLRIFHKKGISYGINTDDPGIFGINLIDEYSFVLSNFELDYSALQKSVTNSISAAFCTNDEKRKLYELVQANWS